MAFDKQGKPPFRHILRQEVLPDKVFFFLFFYCIEMYCFRFFLN